MLKRASGPKPVKDSGSFIRMVDKKTVNSNMLDYIRAHRITNYANTRANNES